MDFRGVAGPASLAQRLLSPAPNGGGEKTTMHRHADRRTDEDALLEALRQEEAEPEGDRDEHRRQGEALFRRIARTYGSTPAGIAEGIADLVQGEAQERAVMLAIHRQMGNQVALEIRAALRLHRGEAPLQEEPAPAFGPPPEASDKEEPQ